MKSAFWDTLKNGQFQCKSIPMSKFCWIEQGKLKIEFKIKFALDRSTFQKK